VIRTTMIGLATAMIISAAPMTGASAARPHCGWVNSPIFLPKGGTVLGQVWYKDCGERGSVNGGTQGDQASCEHWRYVRTKTPRGVRPARWCPNARL
jgi:hypothetical protein